MDLGHDVLKDKQFRFPALKHITWLVIGVKVWALYNIQTRVEQ